MKDRKRGSHTAWDCKFHLVWATKYRYQALGSDVALRCREVLREIAVSKGMVIYVGSIRTHVHRYTTPDVGIQRRPVSDREELTQITLRV